jgi:hypothetical protein
LEESVFVSGIPNKGPRSLHLARLRSCDTFFGRPWWRGSEVRWWSVFSLLFLAGRGGEGAAESFIDLFFLFGCWCYSWCLGVWDVLELADTSKTYLLSRTLLLWFLL